MTDRATPNLPSRDFDATSAFYRLLGFQESWRDRGWMILERQGLQLEFFPHEALDTLASWFSCCLRLDDLDRFVAACRAAGIKEADRGIPRLQLPRVEESGFRIAYVIDLDGSLLRMIENPRA